MSKNPYNKKIAVIYVVVYRKKIQQKVKPLSLTFYAFKLKLKSKSIFLLVKEEIFFLGVVGPDVLDTFVGITLVLHFL